MPFVSSDPTEVPVVCVLGGVGVQWEAKDEPTARRTGRTPDQAQRTGDKKRPKAEVLRRPEDRRRLQLAWQETRRPICHLARPPRRPGKETISIRMLMVRRSCAYHRPDDI